MNERTRTAKGTFKADPRRDEALARGEKRYLGEDCPQNHGGWRFVSNYGCCECLRLQCRQYYERNKAAQLQRNQDYIKDNPEANAARSRKWAKENPMYLKMAKHKRREKLRDPSIKMLTPKQWEEIKAKYGYECLCCGRKEPEIKLEMDHVVPVQKGGKHTYDNIQPLCRRCNASKNSHVIDYRGNYEQTVV